MRDMLGLVIARLIGNGDQSVAYVVHPAHEVPGRSVLHRGGNRSHTDLPAIPGVVRRSAQVVTFVRIGGRIGQLHFRRKGTGGNLQRIGQAKIARIALHRDLQGNGRTLLTRAADAHHRTGRIDDLAPGREGLSCGIVRERNNKGTGGLFCSLGRDARVKEKDTRHRSRAETPHVTVYLLTCWHVSAINSHMSMKYITQQERPRQVLYGAIFEKSLLYSEIITDPEKYSKGRKRSRVCEDENINQVRAARGRWLGFRASLEKRCPESRPPARDSHDAKSRFGKISRKRV